MSKRAPTPERPLRGKADDTREALVETAARVFNEVGYHGTDSNALAREAGYSPGTFYRHFEDKRGIFLAAYARWVRREWEQLERALDAPEVRAATAGPGAPDLELAAHLVDFMITHHRKWRVFRASLRALDGTDEEVQRFHRLEVKRELELLAGLRRRAGGRKRGAEEDLLLLLTLERTCDALAEGEVEALGAGKQKVLKLLLEQVERHFR